MSAAKEPTETPDGAPAVKLSLPAVHIKKRRALPFFSRHPWVFAGAIRIAIFAFGS